MAVYHAGVSERVFEFAFNSEFCASRSAVIAGCPYIPTQNQEKRLGFDVAFLLKNAGAVRFLYLQHKVSRKVDGASRSNTHFRSAAGMPYYAFPIDVDQYNLIHKFSQKKSREFYYCAPRFTSRKELNDHFKNGGVALNSVWIDISACGTLTNTESHCIVYPENGSRAFVFSEHPDARPSIVHPAEVETFPSDRTTKLTTASLRDEYEEILETVSQWWREDRFAQRRTGGIDSDFRMRLEPPQRRGGLKNPTDMIAAIRELTNEYLGVTWLIQEI
ncbi:hypothetical protein D9M69_346340 [compost metagenome]